MLNTSKKKIAIVGSAPSSVNLAPYRDPEWYIMGCSPGAYGVAGPHSDGWMEAHRWEPQIPGHAGTGKPWFSPEYCEFLIRHPGKVWMSEPIPPEFRNAKPIPVEELVKKYGPFFFTSSIAWMLAIALETSGVEEIGLFGVDMAAKEEYGYQRAGCQHFITIAHQRGIKVTIPPESDILQPTYWYGVTENHPMMIKMTARRDELLTRRQQAEHQFNAAKEQVLFLNGALDDVEYMINTWVTSQSWLNPSLGETGNENRNRSDELEIVLPGEP